MYGRKSMEEEEEDRIGSTYVGKDGSISHLLAKWRLTSNENIASHLPRLERLSTGSGH